MKRYQLNYVCDGEPRRTAIMATDEAGALGVLLDEHEVDEAPITVALYTAPRLVARPSPTRKATAAPRPKRRPKPAKAPPAKAKPKPKPAKRQPAIVLPLAQLPASQQANLDAFLASLPGVTS